MIEVANDAEYAVADLKRCRCGGQAEVKERSGRTFPFWVQCLKCGALTTFTRSAGAAKALWNTGRIQPGMTDG